MKRRAPAALVVLGLLAAAFAACGLDESWSPIPPPAPQATVALRAVHAVDPRFPRLTEAQFRDLLAESAVLARQHFGARVAYAIQPETSIAGLAAIAPAKAVAYYRPFVLPLPLDAPGMERLIAAARAGCRWEPAGGALPAYLVRWAGWTAAAAADCDLLAPTLARRHGDGVAHFRAEAGLPLESDGRTADLTQWVPWHALGHGDLPYDVIVTNLPVAGAEVMQYSPHAALRSGITGGSVQYSRKSRMGAFAWISTYPALGTEATVVALRGGERYDNPAEPPKLLAVMLGHELGHLLFHYAHPWDNPACLMFPLPRFEFRRFRALLDPAACLAGASAAMRPGAAALSHPTHLP